VSFKVATMTIKAYMEGDPSYLAGPVADLAIGVGGRVASPRPSAKNLAPPGRKFQTIDESLPSVSCKHVLYKHA